MKAINSLQAEFAKTGLQYEQPRNFYSLSPTIQPRVESPTMQPPNFAIDLSKSSALDAKSLSWQRLAIKRLLEPKKDKALIKKSTYNFQVTSKPQNIKTPTNKSQKQLPIVYKPAKPTLQPLKKPLNSIFSNDEIKKSSSFKVVRKVVELVKDIDSDFDDYDDSLRIKPRYFN